MSTQLASPQPQVEAVPKDGSAKRFAIIGVGTVVLVLGAAFAPAQESRGAASRKAESRAATLERFDRAVESANAKAESGHGAQALAEYDALILECLAERLGSDDPKELAFYRDVLARVDVLARKIETPEFEAAILSRDLLSEAERRPWAFGPGLKPAFGPTGLALSGRPSAGPPVAAMAWIGVDEKPPWRDLVIDLEFTIEEGGFDLHLRHAPGWSSYVIRFEAASGFEKGKPHAATLRVRGSEVTLQQPGSPVKSDKFAVTTSPVGGVGLALPSGSKVTISRLIVKVLR